MLAEIPALPLSMHDRVTRVTRRCAAAADTTMSPRYSRSTSPGCGALCMRIILRVIVLIVNEDCILAFKLEGQPPVPADPQRPVVL